MNIESANNIQLSEVLNKLGILPKKKHGAQYYYLSPFRQEKTASFTVNIKLNQWFDFGEGRGGGIVGFVCAYLENQGVDNSVKDALRWLQNMMGDATAIKPVPVEEHKQETGALEIKEVNPITNVDLNNYLIARGISIDAAQRYLKELIVYNHNSRKKFKVLGIPNEDEGWELRNEFFKGTLKSKDITFIRGTDVNNRGIHIFEGFMDYLSIITQRQGEAFEDDMLILNSLVNLPKVSAYLYQYGYQNVWTWLDNDEAGQKALRSLADYFPSEKRLKHQPMNSRYEGYKDVNEWHIATCKPAV